MKIDKTSLKQTTDIWFCAFLQLKGYKIITFDKLIKNKVRCYFDLTEDEWSTLKLEFNNSELIKYKTVIEQIKDLGF